MDSKWFWIGIAAIGALFLLPEKKKKRRRTAMSSLRDSYKLPIADTPIGNRAKWYESPEDFANALLSKRYADKTFGQLYKELLSFANLSKRQYDRLRKNHPEYAEMQRENLNRANRVLETIDPSYYPGLKNTTLRQYWNYVHGVKEKMIPEKRGQMTMFGAISLDVKKRCSPDITRKKIRCRVQQPKEFDGFFTRQSTTPGVSYVMGLVDGKGITQSVMFDKKIWDIKQAKTWFNRNINRLLEGDRRALNLQG